VGRDQEKKKVWVAKGDAHHGESVKKIRWEKNGGGRGRLSSDRRKNIPVLRKGEKKGRNAGERKPRLGGRLSKEEKVCSKAKRIQNSFSRAGTKMPPQGGRSTFQRNIKKTRNAVRRGKKRSPSGGKKPGGDKGVNRSGPCLGEGKAVVDRNGQEPRPEGGRKGGGKKGGKNFFNLRKARTGSPAREGVGLRGSVKSPAGKGENTSFLAKREKTPPDGRRRVTTPVEGVLLL